MSVVVFSTPYPILLRQGIFKAMYKRVVPECLDLAMRTSRALLLLTRVAVSSVVRTVWRSSARIYRPADQGKIQSKPARRYCLCPNIAGGSSFGTRQQYLRFAQARRENSVQQSWTPSSQLCQGTHIECSSTFNLRTNHAVLSARITERQRTSLDVGSHPPRRLLPMALVICGTAARTTGRRR